MTDDEKKMVTFTSLTDALEFLGKEEEELARKGTLFGAHFKELCGYHPQQPVTASDVVKIVSRMLSGNETGGDVKA